MSKKLLIITAAAAMVAAGAGVFVAWFIQPETVVSVQNIESPVQKVAPHDPGT